LDTLFNNLQHPLMPKQTRLLLLRYCGLPSLNYLLRVNPPHLTDIPSKRFDDITEQIVLKTIDEDDSKQQVLRRVKTQIRLPIRSGGLGFRSTNETRHAAYYASLANAAPLLFPIINEHNNNPNPNSPLNAAGNLLPLPIEQDIIACHNALQLRNALPPSPSIPRNPSLFFTHFADAPPLHSQKLQKLLIAKQELDNETSFRSSLTRAGKARIMSSASKSASYFLTTMPTEAEYIMKDSSFTIALRHRLGLHPVPNMPTQCICGKNITNDITHIHTCVKFKRKGATLRHNYMLLAFNNLLRLAGIPSQMEQLISTPINGAVVNLQPDVVFSLTRGGYWIDVSVVCPTAPSYVSGAAISSLSAAKKRDQQKKSKYSTAAAQHGVDFFPLVYESFGAPSPLVVTLLNDNL